MSELPDDLDFDLPELEDFGPLTQLAFAVSYSSQLPASTVDVGVTQNVVPLTQGINFFCTSFRHFRD